MLTKEAVEEFKRIYKRNYKIELTDEEAMRRAENLVALYAAVYGGSHFGRVENEQQENVNKIDNYANKRNND